MAGNGRNRIRIAALGAFILVATGCSGAATTTTSVAPTTAPPTTTTTVTTTVPPTTATSTTTTTTTVDPLARPEKLVSNFDRDSVDDFDTTGDNLWQVMLEIEDLYDYLEGNPQGTGEEMLGLFYAEDYENFDELADDLNQLSMNNWRYVDAGTRTVAIDVDSVENDTAVVTWASERGDQLVADASGAIVKTLDGWDLDVITYKLVRGPDRRWRIAEFVERLFPVPPEVLESMVPVEWTGRSE